MTDHAFAPTLGIEIVDGRGFDEYFGTDADGVILNETAVETIGWEDPVGHTIEYPGDGTYRVFGVMRDFNFLTMHVPIAPFALFHRDSESYTIPESYVVARISGSDVETTLREMEGEWSSFVLDSSFSYSFLDDSFEQENVAEARMGRLFSVFSLLTVFIACIGITGLAAFAAERRRKEIGIRKVLGASVSGIVALLSKDFMVLLLVAFAVSVPPAYVGVRYWLDGFAHRIGVGWWLFATAGLFAAGLAVATVAIQAIRVASADPVKSLQYE